MTLPNSIIAKVNNIGKKQNQGREFRFTDRRNDPFSWTDEAQEDNEEIQGILEQDEAPFLDIAAKLPGIELERDQTDGSTDAVDDDP